MTEQAPLVWVCVLCMLRGVAQTRLKCVGNQRVCC